VIIGSLESLKIDLKGLEAEATSLTFDLDDSFFEALDGAEVKKGSLHVSVSIRKAPGFYELQLHTVGTIIIPCDRCLDDMEQPVDTENRLVAKLGSEYSEEDDIIVVPEDEGILDISWFIYEFAILVIPIRHVHAPGKCNPAMTQALEELSADRSSDEESNQSADPRWEKLKNLNV
jgi:uncharacterized metal-binding protein YceD (DUF177 family)